MEDKNLIIGAFTNYNYNQLKPWVESICQLPKSKDIDKVMVVGNASAETINELKKRDFTIVPMPQMNLPIHVGRFVAIYEYLRENFEEYDFVVTTDVKDVYFQTDPFDWMCGELDRYQKTLVAGSESMLYKDEPWGNENLLQAYGPYIHNIFKENEIYNVGTIGGCSEFVKDLVFNIFTNAINRPIPIVDQAVYNVLLQTAPYKYSTVFAKQSDGWACQAGTTVDPSKIDKFRPFLLEAEPIFEDGIVKTSLGEPFCIVHQYDRVPEWKKFVAQKYGQEDESQYFRYKIG